MAEYAIVRAQGKQYRVAPGQTLLVDRMEQAPGETVSLTEVLLLSQADQIRVGNPTVAGARVEAVVEGQERGEKIIVFKFKSKTRYRRKRGHRQHLTRLTIQRIVTESEPQRRPRPRAQRARQEKSDGA